MANFTVTQEQLDRSYSWALGQLLGQKPVGSGDPDNEFSIITTSNGDGTYTVITPSLTGRATRAQVQAVLDDPNPPQPPKPAPSTREVAQVKIDDDTATLADIREVLKTR